MATVFKCPWFEKCTDKEKKVIFEKAGEGVTLTMGNTTNITVHTSCGMLFVVNLTRDAVTAEGKSLDGYITSCGSAKNCDHTPDINEND